MIGTAAGAAWPLLVFRMLRYRVAILLWLFLLLGAASHETVRGAGWKLLAAALSLAAAYVAATTVNDVADRDIDLVNHAGDPGRPLVSGAATEGDLLLMHRGAALVAIVSVLPLGPAAVVVMAGSIVISWAYSLPPLRLSYRTYLSPLILSIAYVVVPYAIGSLAVGGHWAGADEALVGSLLSLFLARIVLKDFRDRAGDGRYGRPTLLLRFGKLVTCAVSLAALGVGNALLLVALRPPLAVVALLEVFVIAIASQLRAIVVAEEPRDEQLAIGMGARMGNGLLVSVLAWLLLLREGTTLEERLAVLVCLTGLYFAGFVAVLRHPERAEIGYKG